MNVASAVGPMLQPVIHVRRATVRRPCLVVLFLDSNSMRANYCGRFFKLQMPFFWSAEELLVSLKSFLD